MSYPRPGSLLPSFQHSAWGQRVDWTSPQGSLTWRSVRPRRACWAALQVGQTVGSCPSVPQSSQRVRLLRPSKQSLWYRLMHHPQSGPPANGEHGGDTPAPLRPPPNPRDDAVHRFACSAPAAARPPGRPQASSRHSPPQAGPRSPPSCSPTPGGNPSAPRALPPRRGLSVVVAAWCCLFWARY